MGEDYTVSDKRIEEVYRQTISTFWHTYTFFKTYVDKSFKPQRNFKPKNILDKWMISRLNHANKEVLEQMENYHLTEAGRALIALVDETSNWYVRRSRRRFQKPQTQAEKNEAAQALYKVLLTTAKMAAPMMPFLAEEVYLGLKKPRMAESVHLCDFPEPEKKLISETLEVKMQLLRESIAKALAERASAGLKIRQPLASLKIKNENSPLKGENELLELLKDELNVKEVVFDLSIKNDFELDKKITKELKEEGLAREIIRHIQDLRKEGGLTRKDEIVVKFATKGKKLGSVLANWEKIILKETIGQPFAEVFESKKIIGEKDLSLEDEKLKITVRKI